MSCVSSVGSAWMLQYYQEPGHAFSRGLRSVNPRDATECSLGTCCAGPQDLPKMPVSMLEERKQRNIEFLSGRLRDLGVESPSHGARGAQRVTGIQLPENRTRALKCADVARYRYQTY